jgi:RNA polymerase sigma factor (sigma-70 family)
LYHINIILFLYISFFKCVLNVKGGFKIGEYTLYNLFHLAKSENEEAKLELIKKFLPCINGFGKKLYYEESETDLTIFLLEFIRKIDLNKFKNRNDGEIINYMHSAFKSKYINTLRQLLNNKKEQNFVQDFIWTDNYDELDKDYFLSLLDNLCEIQKKIIIGKYYYCYTDIELANMLSVSRQTIYNHKKKALSNIKANMEGGDYCWKRDYMN